MDFFYLVPWIEIGAAYAVSFAFCQIAGFFLRKSVKHLENVEGIWLYTFMRTLRRPFYALVWFLAFLFSLQVLSERFADNKWLKIPFPVLKMGFLLLFFWFGLSFIRAFEKRILDKARGKKSVDLTLISTAFQLFRVFFVIGTLIIFLDFLGVSPSTVIAFGGLGGIAMGLAAKDFISNFFGFFSIILDSPFKIGDEIRSSTHGIAGDVEHIGWRATRILSKDKRPVYVPNSVFSTISVENVSLMTHRALETVIGVPYKNADKMALLVCQIRSLIDSTPEIDKKKESIVNFNEFGSIGLNIYINCFFEKASREIFYANREKFFLQILEIFKKEGVEIAHFSANYTFSPRE